MRDAVIDARGNNSGVLSCCLGPDRGVGQENAVFHCRPLSCI